MASVRCTEQIRNPDKVNGARIKTTFRGCFYPRALPRVFEPAAQKQYKKTPPEKVAFFYIGHPHSI